MQDHSPLYDNFNDMNNVTTQTQQRPADTNTIVKQNNQTLRRDRVNSPVYFGRADVVNVDWKGCIMKSPQSAVELHIPIGAIPVNTIFTIRRKIYTNLAAFVKYINPCDGEDFVGNYTLFPRYWTFFKSRSTRVLTFSHSHVSSF